MGSNISCCKSPQDQVTVAVAHAASHSHPPSTISGSKRDNDGNTLVVVNENQPPTSPNVEGTPTSRRVSTESSPLYDDENKPNAPSSLSSHMDIDDKPSVELSPEDKQELDDFLTEMSADKMNIIKHVMQGGKLPKALYKFTQNNVLAELPSCNEEAEDNLIDLAVETFGDKARFIKQYTLTANLVLPCIGLQFSFPVKGHNLEMIGPLRANNEFLDEMGIHQ